MSSGQRPAGGSSYAAGRPAYPSSYGQAGAYPPATGAAYAGGRPGYSGGGAAMPSAAGAAYGGSAVPAVPGSASTIDAPDVTSPDRPGSGGLTGSLEA
jgi:hypothetical protein